MKYCDIVMKGGITSGIVYPNVALALAREYRFKNIGGTSAGAIAAAACAAAAYGDRIISAGQSEGADQESSIRQGFRGLAEIASRLATEGSIASLFQPAPEGKRAYALLTTISSPGGRSRKAVAVLQAVLAIAPGAVGSTLLALLSMAYLIGGISGTLGAALPAAACAILGGSIRSIAKTAAVARRNYMGLCNGMKSPRAPAGANPPLTEWLHEILQALAGRGPETPLTFNDLRAAPRYPDEPASKYSLNLQMITTSVSHHEPRTLPMEKGQFWFRQEDFAALFPADVVRYLEGWSSEKLDIDGHVYRKLPTGGDLPVIVATRMSLSFPLLISAVPLYEPAGWKRRHSVDSDREDAGQVDRSSAASILAETEALAGGGKSTDENITAMRQCWFSDGGISSNFPIHLFDAPIPAWPTFAINLVYPDGGSASHTNGADVWLPESNNSGWQPSYRSIASSSAVTEIARFVFGIIGTMQNWRDLMLSRSPGQRDRIVHIALAADEGGMNLEMDQAVLDRVSRKGERAGEALGRFSFANHLWIRYRSTISAHQRHVMDIGAISDKSRLVADYADAYSTIRNGEPAPVSYKFRSRETQEGARLLLDELVSQGTEWADLGPDLTDGAPRPLPVLRIAPTF